MYRLNISYKQFYITLNEIWLYESDLNAPSTCSEPSGKQWQPSIRGWHIARWRAKNCLRPDGNWGHFWRRHEYLYLFVSQIKCRRTFFLTVQLTISHHWFSCLDNEQATSHYLNHWWSSLLTHICVNRPRWVGRKQLNRLPLVPHMCVSESVSIDSDNGLSPIRRQAII